MTVYEPQFNVDFNYNQVENVQLENILWTVRVSILTDLINALFLIKSY